MTALAAAIIPAVAARYGYRLRAFSGDDANDIIAEDFQRTANHFLAVQCAQTLPRYPSDIAVSLHFVDPLYTHFDGFDVLVVPTGEVDRHHFAILISMGILRGLTSAYASLAADPADLLSGTAAGSINDRFETQIYPQVSAALIFMLFHEFGHVLRGHLPYFFGTDYRLAAGNAFHLIASQTEAIPLSAVRTHRAMEIDADLLALGLMLYFFTDKELNKDQLFPPLLLRDASLAGEAVYILMRLLELWRREKTKRPYDPALAMHPHPDVRHIFLEAWMRARELEQHELVPVLPFFSAGSKRAQEKLGRLGKQFLPDMEYLREAGAEVLMAEYDVLKTDLYAILKPALETFIA